MKRSTALFGWVLVGLTAALGCHDTPVESGIGALRITMTTTGRYLDSDGYTVGLFLFLTEDTVTMAQAVPVNGSTSVTGLAEGEYVIGLHGVAANCWVATAPNSVRIISDATTQVPFEITCAGLGELRVTTATTGVDRDPGGYTLSVNGAHGLPLGINGAVTLTVRDEEHRVELRAVASNCQVSGEHPRTVVVTHGETTPVEFHLTCIAVEKLAFYHWYSFPCDPDHPFTFCHAPAIAVMYADGSEAIDLVDGRDPAWSPDGSRIVFAQEDGIAVLTLSDRSVAHLPTPESSGTPEWSPDGSKIAFGSDGLGGYGLYLMNADGSNIMRLTPSAREGIAWSPDGALIAFGCAIESGNPDICVVSAEDTGVVVRLTSDPARDFNPAWSPDGTRIAFATTRYGPGDSEIAIMNQDGSGITRLRPGASGSEPAWSADGERIAFSDGWINVINSDGSGLVRLRVGSQPAWRPVTQVQ